MFVWFNNWYTYCPQNTRWTKFYRYATDVKLNILSILKFERNVFNLIKQTQCIYAKNKCAKLFGYLLLIFQITLVSSCDRVVRNCFHATWTLIFYTIHSVWKYADLTCCMARVRVNRIVSFPRVTFVKVFQLVVFDFIILILSSTCNCILMYTLYTCRSFFFQLKIQSEVCISIIIFFYFLFFTANSNVKIII